MAGHTTTGGGVEMVIPSHTLRGDPSDMIAELDLLVVGLLALRRGLGGDARAPIVLPPGSGSLPERERRSRINWPWRRPRPDAAGARGGRW